MNLKVTGEQRLWIFFYKRSQLQSQRRCNTMLGNSVVLDLLCTGYLVLNRGLCSGKSAIHIHDHVGSTCQQLIPAKITFIVHGFLALSALSTLGLSQCFFSLFLLSLAIFLLHIAIFLRSLAIT